MIKSRIKTIVVIAIGTILLFLTEANAQRQMENLGRGIVAVYRGIGRGGNKVYVGWRMLGTDPENIAFNLYRSTGGGEPVKLNDRPITQSTNYIDTVVSLNQPNSYFVRPVLDSQEQEPRDCGGWQEALEYYACDDGDR